MTDALLILSIAVHTAFVINQCLNSNCYGLRTPVCVKPSEIEGYTVDDEEPIINGCVYPWRRRSSEPFWDTPCGWRYERPPLEGQSPGMFEEDIELLALRSPSGKFYFEAHHAPSWRRIGASFWRD